MGIIRRWINYFHRLFHQADLAVTLGRQNKRLNRRIEESIQKEFMRRDVWAFKDEEVRRLAKGRKIWVIKCPAPDSDAKYKWGDYAYCQALQAVIERAGFYAVVECYEDWYEPIRADIALVMRGAHLYHPDRRNTGCRYLMWNVVHPEQVADEEYELYDRVYVDSLTLADRLDQRLSVPVSGMIVGVDTAKFHPGSPENRKPVKYGLVFVGNTRGELRDCVAWCEKYHIRVDIWGNGWDSFYSGDTEYLHFHDPISYDRLPDLYRKSAVVLNDHFPTMREVGMVNNRMIEAPACGCPVVSDYSPEYERLPGRFFFYHGEDDFADAVKQAMNHAAEWRKETEEQFEVLEAGYSMENCIRRILSDLEADEKIIQK